jgi:hypothetical protein
MSGIDDSPRVLVIGILTKTASPHVAISFACRSISSNSSAKTSKEIGMPPVAASASRANAS